jgi:hypothetical protein
MGSETDATQIARIAAAAGGNHSRTKVSKRKEYAMDLVTMTGRSRPVLVAAIGGGVAVAIVIAQVMRRRSSRRARTVVNLSGRE